MRPGGPWPLRYPQEIGRGIRDPDGLNEVGVGAEGFYRAKGDGMPIMSDGIRCDNLSHSRGQVVQLKNVDRKQTKYVEHFICVFLLKCRFF